MAPNSFVNARVAGTICRAYTVCHTVKILHSTGNTQCGNQFCYQIFDRKHWNPSKRTSGVGLRGQNFCFLPVKNNTKSGKVAT